MDKKIIIIIILASLIPLILLIFSIVSPKEDLSPVSKNLESCKTLEVNDNKATNLVFFSEKDEVEKYKEFFKETSPFDKNKKAFNFYYIDSYKPKCELYKGIAILCHSKELIKKAASCPNDYLIVLEEKSPNIRSSSYQNVLSINTNHQLSVLTHEFGHSFANLAEEYTPAKIPSGSKNCVLECNNFVIETNGCFEGCSQDNYKRSISNGVMRTLSSNEYGTLNEFLILEKIPESIRTITTKTTHETKNCENEKYYLIEGKYNNKIIEVVNKSIEIGCIGNNGAGDFKYFLKTSDGKTLTESEFNPELIFTDMQNDNLNEINGEVFESDKNFLLKIPIIQSGETLSINKDENELIKIRLNEIGSKPCLK